MKIINWFPELQVGQTHGYKCAVVFGEIVKDEYDAAVYKCESLDGLVSQTLYPDEVDGYGARYHENVFDCSEYNPFRVKELYLSLINGDRVLTGRSKANLTLIKKVA